MRIFLPLPSFYNIIPGLPPWFDTQREDENRIKFVFPIALSARLRRVAGGVVKELDIKRVNQYYIADH